MKPTLSRARVLLTLGMAGLVILLAVRMRAAAEPSEEQTRTTVKKVLDDQVAAWNRGDLEGFMKGYWLSDKLTFFSEDRVQRGWQETHDRYRKRYQAEGKEMGSLKFDDLQIDPTGPKSALVRGRWELTFKDGKTAGGLFTLLFRDEKQGWCIVHDHTSAKPSP